MTFGELKAKLDTLTPEQLACDVACSGDDFEGGWANTLWVAEEDWLLTEEGAEPRSVIPAEDEADLRVIIPKGTPQLMISRRRGGEDQVFKQVAITERG